MTSSNLFKNRFAYLKWFIVILAFNVVAINSAYAQNGYGIAGELTDTIGRPIPAATVFIVGMTKITSTDNNGTFRFSGFQPGTYQVSVSILGYAKQTETVFITDSSVNLRMILHAAPIALKEVVIGGKDTWNADYKLFKKVFLGTSDNAKKCRIVNPEVLTLKFDKKTTILKASADEFLIIENEALGYKVRYLLKEFSYNVQQDHALYNGDTNFDEIAGTEKQKKQWTEARRKAYSGSLMQLFRAMYSKDTHGQGFKVNQAYERVVNMGGWGFDQEIVFIDPNEMDMDVITKPADNGLMKLQFVKLLITYDPKSAGKEAKVIPNAGKKQVVVGDKCTLLYLLTNGAVIDKKGNSSGPHNFLVQGAMAKNRVADQLPFEYQP